MFQIRIKSVRKEEETYEWNFSWNWTDEKQNVMESNQNTDTWYSNLFQHFSWNFHIVTVAFFHRGCVDFNRNRPLKHVWQHLRIVLHICHCLRGYCTPGPSNKVSYGFGQKCSKELKNHSFTSAETIVVKLQWKMCENQYFPCFEP